MRRNGQVFIYLVLVATLSMSLFVPTMAGAQAPAGDEPYKVGFVNHLTGDMAPYGQSLKKGTELAVDQINAAGGVNGHPIEVIYEDDRGQAADAITAFTKLVETDKVPVVMGSASSTKTLAICPKAQESKVVLVSSVSTAPALKECGKYFFSMMVSDDAQGEEWVKIADYFKAQEAAVMYINNDYGNGVKDVFVKAFEAAGGKILIQQPFEEGGKDFRTEVLKVKQTNPKVVFIVDHTAEGAIVLKQAKELQLNAQFVTDVSMVAKETLEGAGAAAEGVMGVRAASPTGPVWEKFKADFQAKFDTEPTIWADFAYDTMMMVAKAIEVGGYTADGIQQAMFKVGETVRWTVRPEEAERVWHRHRCLRVGDRQGRRVGSVRRSAEGGGRCGPQAATGEPYKVGFVNHLTGDMAPYGQSLKKGTELAVDQINAAGGVNGHPIEVIYEDDRGQAADAITAFTKLVETDKVPVVMGSASSTKTLAICPKAQESKVVLVSSVSTAPALKECGKYFFSMMVSDDAQGEEWVKIADYLQGQEAAVMYINNDYGNGVKDVFVKAFEAAGGKILIAAAV